MAEANPNARLEAFCDGVFAIALTLLIIDIRIPSPESIKTAPELWQALRDLAPKVFAFLWSFAIILVTWVNHHAALKLAARTSASFIYANGFMLLCVVFLPFPTALMGEFIHEEHAAAPAVVLYVSVMVAQSIAWVLLGETALSSGIVRDEQARAAVRANTTKGYYGLAIYAICAVIAFWYPRPVVVVTALLWVFWLILGLRLKHDQTN